MNNKKLNTERPKGGYLVRFKKKLHQINEIRKRFILTDKEAKEIDETLARIRGRINEKIASFDGDRCWDIADYFQLLYIADNAYLGKSQAIEYAFALGYLYGNSTYNLPEEEAREDEQNG